MTLAFSIIVNTYNRARHLADCLLGLSELPYPQFEVIVVNGPSTDATGEVLEGWQKEVKIGACPAVNLSMSRNIGIEMAAGDLIAFIDDDAIPHPAWLKHLAWHYGDSRVGGVGGFTIDNTGVRHQVRKTVCDRYGNAFFPSDFFDERPLCFPGSPLYPSLLGTNSSFRASALREIGGFDHTFAYLLDETDVCLRLVDRGWRIHYEPDAMVFHQFAPSHLRDSNRVPKTLYPSAVSKSYFIGRHGLERRPDEELRKYETDILRANKWLADHGDISSEHRVSLDDDLLFGIKDGTERALRTLLSDKRQQGDLDLSKTAVPFRPLPGKTGLRIAFVSRSFPPHQESGIARWTWMMAAGLAERGHKVHVITLAPMDASTRYENGYWIHAIKEDTSYHAEQIAAAKRIPASVAAWCSAVERQVQILKGFGLDVVSFPIWDVEGIAVADDPSIGVVMSLHTTYGMAKPFKPEWMARPLFGHLHFGRVIAAESELLKTVPHILANSEAIVDDLTKTYSVDFRDRTVIVPHGTLDPAPERAGATGMRIDERQPSAPLKLAFVGRFELRKGFEIACAAFAKILDEQKGIEIFLAGQPLDQSSKRLMEETGGDRLSGDSRVHFLGTLTRAQLNQLYLSVDIVLMPSKYESFGLVAIEAMAAGAAVIALASGGLKEVLEDGSTGYLINPGENAVNEIVDRIIQLASSPKKLASIKAAARKAYLERFTVQQMAEGAERIYLEAARKQS